MFSVSVTEVLIFWPWLIDVMLLSELAAFCAAEKTDEKNPLGGCVRVPPGVLVSSSVGVRGAVATCESLLGGLELVVADRARRWTRLPEGVTTTLGIELVDLCSALEEDEGLLKRLGGASRSVGVGGVRTVVGA